MLFRNNCNKTLVREMLDRLPADVWVSNATTFLDPAMASGQFVTEIERRLRAMGHSNENIKTRVFGLEMSRMQMNIAVNMNELIGTYAVDSNYKAFLSSGAEALSKDWPVKFDIIVGNPPYQNGGVAGNFALWPLFVTAATDSLVDGGHLLFVVPQTWCTNQKIAKARSKASSLIRSNALSNGTLRYADFSIGEFFPGIGSTFSMIDWVKKHTGQKTTVKTPQGSFDIDYSTVDWLPCLGDERTISILKKTIWGSSKKMELLNGGAEIAGFRFGRDTISKTRTKTFKHKIANTSAQYTRGQFLYSSVEHPNQHESKVVFSDSGYAAPFFDNSEVGLGHHARAFKATAMTADAIISMMNSKIVAFAAKAYLSGTASSPVSLVMDSIPSIPRPMSDKELYKHFELTRAEIDLIERTIK